jgi:hypothetical protein
MMSEWVASALNNGPLKKPLLSGSDHALSGGMALRASAMRGTLQRFPGKIERVDRDAGAPRHGPGVVPGIPTYQKWPWLMAGLAFREPPFQHPALSQMGSPDSPEICLQGTAGHPQDDSSFHADGPGCAGRDPAVPLQSHQGPR